MKRVIYEYAARICAPVTTLPSVPQPRYATITSLRNFYGPFLLYPCIIMTFVEFSLHGVCAVCCGRGRSLPAPTSLSPCAYAIYTHYFGLYPRRRTRAKHSNLFLTRLVRALRRGCAMAAQTLGAHVLTGGPIPQRESQNVPDVQSTCQLLLELQSPANVMYQLQLQLQFQSEAQSMLPMPVLVAGAVAVAVKFARAPVAVECDSAREPVECSRASASASASRVCLCQVAVFILAVAVAECQSIVPAPAPVPVPVQVAVAVAVAAPVPRAQLSIAPGTVSSQHRLAPPLAARAPAHPLGSID